MTSSNVLVKEEFCDTLTTVNIDHLIVNFCFELCSWGQGLVSLEGLESYMWL